MFEKKINFQLKFDQLLGAALSKSHGRVDLKLEKKTCLTTIHHQSIITS